MVRVTEYVREKVIVHVSDQLRRRGIVGGVQAEPDSTHCVSKNALTSCDDFQNSFTAGKPAKFRTKTSNIIHHTYNMSPHYREQLRCSNLLHFVVSHIYY